MDGFKDRQEKVLRRMLEEGPDGFEGGMNARKYIGIAKTSNATATRDMQDLLEIGAFKRLENCIEGLIRYQDLTYRSHW